MKDFESDCAVVYISVTDSGLRMLSQQSYSSPGVSERQGRSSFASLPISGANRGLLVRKMRKQPRQLVRQRKGMDQVNHL